MHFRRISQLFLFTILFFVLGACGSNSESNGSANTAEEADENQGTITIGQINWPENIAVTNLWKVILENEGYEVELPLIEMGTQMAALAEGDLDIAPEVWLPVQDKNYYENYKDKANFFEEPWYDNGKVGLVVPEYMDDIHSIEDLNEHKEEFNSEITGFEPGAGTMLITDEVIDEYNLDFNLVESSEAAMIITVTEAFNNNEPVVAPLWQPHFVFSDADLKFLEDPKNTYGEIEEIYMATREEFDTDFEEVNAWIRNFQLNDDQLGELMSDVKDNEDNPIVGAEKWVEENQELIEEWMN
ncbi:glycine betaine ABC transporter substrate-binding protein [Oceanobacillus jeddahense]|uniref:glycine betaine ABC transporter substrate-binding protein n=1 Tax=Oceanobacillus jeddahense TaxID=1462527 RepID=UPI00362E3089